MADTSSERLVLLIDMDCFYVQVEQRERPELWDKPVGVLQYSSREGMLIAVSYEARAHGVKRNMRGAEAKAKCAELNLVQVPAQRGKANLTKYRQASAEVFAVLNGYDPLVVVERASIDEAFLDVTQLVDARVRQRDQCALDVEQLPTTHVLFGSAPTADDYDRRDCLRHWLQCTRDDLQALRLSYAAECAEHIRALVRQRTQFNCSAGVAHNKTLAKLICAKNKPRQQTVMAPDYLPTLWLSTKISSVRFLGGKLGLTLQQQLGIEHMSALAACSRAQLMAVCKNGKIVDWLLQLASGVDPEPVKEKQFQRSIASSKNFYGTGALSSSSDVHGWLQSLCEDLAERYADERENNQRLAGTLLCGVHSHSSSASGTRQMRLPDGCTEADQLYPLAVRLAAEFNKSTVDGQWQPAVHNLHVSLTNFDAASQVKSREITQFFNQSTSRTTTTSASPSTAANVSSADDSSCESVVYTNEGPSKRSQDESVSVDSSSSAATQQHFVAFDHDSTIVEKPPDAAVARSSSFDDLFEDDENTDVRDDVDDGTETSATDAQKPSASASAAHQESEQDDLVLLEADSTVVTRPTSGCLHEFEGAAVDPSVFASLPADIQLELRLHHMRSSANANASGSAIARPHQQQAKSPAAKRRPPSSASAAVGNRKPKTPKAAKTTSLPQRLSITDFYAKK